MKVDVCLMGDGFKVSDLKKHLEKLPKFKYELELMQEFGKPRKNGPDKGKPSKFGFCWINGITLKQLKRLGPVFKTYNVDDISINVHEEQIQNQTCLYVDKELIDVAHRLEADIEIVDFEK